MAARSVRSIIVLLSGVATIGALAAPGASAPGRSRGELFGSTSRPTRPAQLPPGFAETTVFSGLTYPTVMQFSPDGRVFVGEKSGTIEVYDSLSDPTPTVFAVLNRKVYDYWDRGLLGLAIDPDFPAVPFVYVLYTKDGPIGVPPPVYNDACADPEGAGCVASARLSRLRADGDMMVGKEKILIEDWCQQFPSHSIGTLAFGPDKALYLGGGDAASFDFADYGQNENPCGDPGGPNPSPPTAEGGALRAQDIRTTGDPTTMDGSILRVSRKTGAALPDNPLYGGEVADDDRIIAHGLRNPFRFAVRPGTDQIWIGDVGWGTWEEIDRLGDANDSVVENFGWPCYEGTPTQSEYDALNLDICENLYSDPGAVTDPTYAYSHGQHVTRNDGCPFVNGSSVSGMAFYEGGTYPPAMEGALFFADHSRDCIWLMGAGSNGEPDPANLHPFESDAGHPVDLKIGPNGDLFYVDYDDGQIREISHT